MPRDAPASDDDDPELECVDFAITVSHFRERLDLMGFTLGAARVAFSQGMRNHVVDLKMTLSYASPPFDVKPEDGTQKPVDMRADYLREIELLENVTLEEWG